MFIHWFTLEQFLHPGESVEVKLPRPGLVLDPRINERRNRKNIEPAVWKVHCRYHDDDGSDNDGTAVTLTWIDNHHRPNEILGSFSMRMYDPAIETVPKFDTTFYTYMGEKDERVPHDTTHSNIHPSVRTIKEHAFHGCDKLKQCTLHNRVATIEEHAFGWCRSLEALFLPPSVNEIQTSAFCCCENIRILSMPLDIDVANKVGHMVFYRCNSLFDTAGIEQYESMRQFQDATLTIMRNLRDQDFNSPLPFDLSMQHILDGCDTFFQTTHEEYDHGQLMYYFVNERSDNNRINQALLHLYRSQSPMHKACLDSNVNVQAIKDCIQTHGSATTYATDHNGMTPLHILAINPHASLGAILACFEVNKSAAFQNDGEDNTPLDYLKEYNFEYYVSLFQALCLHRETRQKGALTNAKAKCGRKRKNTH